MSATFPGHDRARHMGELKRGDERWDVFIEMQLDAEVGAVRGRVHFVNGEHRRTTSWIFLELSEREVQERFGEFSAVELWHFVAALDGRSRSASGNFRPWSSGTSWRHWTADALRGKPCILCTFRFAFMQGRSA